MDAVKTVPALVIDDTDRFFAAQWQTLAQDNAAIQNRTPLLDEQLAVARDRAAYYRARIAGGGSLDGKQRHFVDGPHIQPMVGLHEGFSGVR